MDICPCPLLGAVSRSVLTLVMQCWGSAGAVSCLQCSLLAVCWFSSGLLMNQSWMLHSLCAALERSSGCVRWRLGRSSAFSSWAGAHQ